MFVAATYEYNGMPCKRIVIQTAQQQKKQIFYALFHSKITYGIIIWYATFQTNIFHNFSKIGNR